MNLEKLQREIAMCKSPNVDKWLVPIPDLEGMISLIQRQESELAKSHDENETLKAEREAMVLQLAARQPLADSFVAPGVTVDTPEFRAAYQDFTKGCFPRLVAAVDAWQRNVTEKAVRIAEKEGYCAGYDAAKQEAAQPVAGELPPLPAGWIVRKDDDGVIVVQKHGVGGYAARRDDDNIASYILHAFASDLLTMQPVQQPAAVVGQDTIKDAVNRFLGWKLPKTFNPDCGVSFKPNDAPGGSWPIGTNLFTADEARAMFEHCLPTVPAAGVQGDFERKRADFIAHLSAASAIVEKWPDWKKNIWPDMTPAAAQPNSGHDALAAANSEIERLKFELHEAANSLVARMSGAQPDSGRDAALWDAATDVVRDALDAVAVHAADTNNDAARAKGLHGSMFRLHKVLAAHPAPSSNVATMRDVIALAWKWHREAVTQGFACSEPAQELFELLGWPDADAAHPANGAQAGAFSPTDEQFAEWCERYDMQPNISRDAFDDAASLYLVAPQKKEG